MSKNAKVLLVEHIYNNLQSGSISEEQARKTISEEIEAGNLKPLTKKEAEHLTDEHREFAKNVGLLKSGTGSRGARGGYGALVAEQYPEIAQALAPAMEYAGKKLEIQKDGESVVVSFQPFWRKEK